MLKILKLSNSKLYNMTQFVSISEILQTYHYDPYSRFIITFSNDKVLTIENKDKLLLESIKNDIESFLNDQRTELTLN